MQDTVIEFDETRAQDKEYLIGYYQAVADKWKKRYDDCGCGKKVYQRFQKAADKLIKELGV